MTAGEIITAAYRKLRIRTSESELTSTEISDAIFELNNMMRQYETDGFYIGWTPVSATTDTITTPDWSYRFIYLGLAVLLSSEFGVQLSPVAIADFESARKAVLNMVVHAPVTSSPADMPMGAGNFGIGHRSQSSKFVGNEAENDILTGTGGNLSDETADSLQGG